MGDKEQGGGRGASRDRGSRSTNLVPSPHNTSSRVRRRPLARVLLQSLPANSGGSLSLTGTLVSLAGFTDLGRAVPPVCWFLERSLDAGFTTNRNLFL